MVGYPYVGMKYNDNGGAVSPGDSMSRRGKVIAVYPRKRWFLVRFSKGYCEGFKYLPKEFAPQEG